MILKIEIRDPCEIIRFVHFYITLQTGKFSEQKKGVVVPLNL